MVGAYEMHEDDDGNPLVPDDEPERTHEERVTPEDVARWLWTTAAYYREQVENREVSEWRRRDLVDGPQDTLTLDAMPLAGGKMGEMRVKVDGTVFRIAVTRERTPRRPKRRVERSEPTADAMEGSQ